MIFSLGLLESLKLGLIEIDESFWLLFKPSVMFWLQKHNYSQELIELIHMGTELEDIYDIEPEEFDKVVNKMYDSVIVQLRKKFKINIGSDIAWHQLITSENEGS